jgi:PleD family two-component response regulator
MDGRIIKGFGLGCELQKKSSVIKMTETINGAGLALFQAKSQGRDHVVQWTPDLGAGC